MVSIANQISLALLATKETIEKALDSNIAEVGTQIAESIFESMSSGGKLLLAGNGGSAADAQHIAAEFVNYFNFPRKGLSAIALTTDTSVITSVSNDSSYELVFGRQVEAIGKPGDVLWLYTTSGSSKNIIHAAKVAKENGLTVVCFTGSNTALLSNLCDYIISVPSDLTPKIQEIHLIIGHAISGIVESKFFKNS